MRARTTLALAILASACDPTIFDGVERNAPVVIVPPIHAGTAGQFGAVVVGFESSIRGIEVSRYAVAGGASSGGGSSFAVFSGFDGVGSSAVSRLHEAAAFSGCDMSECAPGIGASIAPFPVWAGPGGMEFHGCVAVPGASGQIQVRCEDQLPSYQTVMGPASEDLGRSAAGIPLARHRLGVALIGAPGARSGQGAIYRLPNGSAPPSRIDLDAAMAPSDAAIGRALALSALDADRVRFAVRADGAADAQRVIVGTIAIDASNVISVAIEGCLEGGRGYGGALAFGDLDGDGVADLAIGHGEEAGTLDAQTIQIFDGAGFGAATDCVSATQPMPSLEIACEDAIEPGGEVACTPAPSLGAALAIADLNGDGVGDLVAGAPNAAPRGRLAAGAVVVLAGSEGSLAMLGTDRAVLTHSSQANGDRLGASVSTVRSRGRHEIVAGAPGTREIAIFACSGIRGDTPSDRPGAERGCL